MDQIRIGAFISQLRKEKNMTQKDLAEKLGITDRAISKWETGRGMPENAIHIGTISDISDHPDEELECSFSHQGRQLYQWAAGGTDYIGVQVSYCQAFAIPIK